MRVEKIKAETISEKIAKNIEENILNGDLLAGDKLPSERVLAEQFEVSRPSIREAINKLQAKGIIFKIPGGGSYICETLGSSFADPLLTLFAEKQDTLYDMLEMRYAIEGLSAYLAALRATRKDKLDVQEKYQRLLTAHNQNEQTQEAKCDVDFHLSIAMAAHNPVLLHIMQNLFKVLQQSVATNLKGLFIEPSQRSSIIGQHTEVLDAILAGKPNQAMTAMQKHLSWVEIYITKYREERLEESIVINRAETLKNLFDKRHQD